MLVKCLVRAVRRIGDATKPGAILTLETTKPLEIHEIRLNKLHVSDGTVAALEMVTGTEIELPLVLEEYNGKKELKFTFGETYAVPRPAAVGKGSAA